MRAIRLFPRTSIQWKDSSKKEADKFALELNEKHIKHRIQLPYFNILQTKRKNKPFDCEFSYYSWQTIQQMCNEFLEGDTNASTKA